MKKCIAILLTIVLMIGIFPAGISRSDAAITFKDVPSNSWYYNHIQFIVNYKYELMVGYAGNFGPLDNLTVEQFIKIAVAAAGKGVVVPKGQYWGDVYVPIGLDLGFVLPGEFTDYKRPITRAEMARIIIRALPSMTGEKDVTYNVNDIKSRMIDYDSIPTNLRDNVCKAYQLGILSGGTDKKFNPNGYLTRASAASVIHLMLDPSARPTAKASEIWNDTEFEQYIKNNAKDYYCIAKIENRKIYWRNAVVTTPTLLSEKNNPGVNGLIYNCAKTLAYYAYKNGNKFSPGYDEMFGGSVSLNYYIRTTNIPGYTDIGVEFFAEPTLNSAAQKYAPGEQESPSYYQWKLGNLYEPGYPAEQGFTQGKDRTKFQWTQPKYEQVFLQTCIDIYGISEGNNFFKFIKEKYMKIAYAGGQTSDKYFNLIPNTGISLSYYYKYPEANDMWFFTSI